MDFIELLKVIFLGIVEGITDQQYRTSDFSRRIYQIKCK